MRHGETDWNKKKLVQGRKDIPLNEYGRHLARETSYGMRQYQIDLAYTSPLRRAKETAEILLEGRNISLYEDQRILHSRNSFRIQEIIFRRKMLKV